MPPAWDTSDGNADRKVRVYKELQDFDFHIIAIIFRRRICKEKWTKAPIMAKRLELAGIS